MKSWRNQDDTITEGVQKDSNKALGGKQRKTERKKHLEATVPKIMALGGYHRHPLRWPPVIPALLVFMPSV